MKKVIIGIHGLANKPKPKQLERWWRDSILEGLEKNLGTHKKNFTFKMVYWANLLYWEQLHNDENFSFDPLYNSEPYHPAEEGELKEYESGIWDSIRAETQEKAGALLDQLKKYAGFQKPIDWLLKRTNLVRDLAFYYDKDRMIADRSKPPKRRQARQVLQDELKNVLTPYKGRSIMLIAHSMGSILAYDVLRDIRQDKEEKDLEVAHFVTIGSPLGLPHVKGKIIDERKYAHKKLSRRLRTPTIVTKRWTNYADRLDAVAFDTHIQDDFQENDGGIRVSDDLVANSYRSPSGKSNHHKSYGYLRTPELSRHILEFLSE
jgi:hypothetical protein